MKHASKVDRSFKYTHSSKTDIRKTFAKQRKILEDEAALAVEQAKKIRKIGEKK